MEGKIKYAIDIPASLDAKIKEKSADMMLSKTATVRLAIKEFVRDIKND